MVIDVALAAEASLPADSVSRLRSRCDSAPAPTHARPAHAARDHRRVAGHAAARGEDAARGVHAVDVLRRVSMRTRITCGPAPSSARPRRRRTRSRQRPRPARRAGPWRAPSCSASGSSVGWSSWSSAAGIDAQHRLLARDQALVGHVDGDLQRGLGRCACPSGSAASRACLPATVNSMSCMSR